MSTRPKMRMVNAVLSAAMLVLFAVHGIGNAIQLTGVGFILVPKAVSWSLVAICVVHAVIGVVLTIDTVRAQRAAGTAYPGLNKRFWIVRISGLAIAVLIVLHVLTFARFGDGPIRLVPFEHFQLIVHILLALALGIHIITNMSPLLISLGIGRPGERAIDFIVVVTILVLLMAIAFIIYFVRWSVL